VLLFYIDIIILSQSPGVQTHSVLLFYITMTSFLKDLVFTHTVCVYTLLILKVFSKLWCSHRAVYISSTHSGQHA